MAALIEDDTFPAEVYQLETTDPVLGGVPDPLTGAGMDNIPHQQLAKRTNWLKIRVDALVAAVVPATTLVAGIVRLSTSTNSDATDLAATPSAVKAAMLNANGRVPLTRLVNTGGLAVGGGALNGDLTITVPAANNAEGLAGADDLKAMTSLRVREAFAQFGLGPAAPVVNTANALNNVDANGVLKVNTVDVATVGGPTGWAGGLVDSLFFGSNNVSQVYAEISGAGRRACRAKINGTWQPWSMIWSDADAAKSFGTNGYQVFPSGLIMQYGQFTMSSGVTTVSLPMTFPTACRMVLTSDVTTGVTSAMDVAVNVVGDFTASSFKTVCRNTANTVITSSNVVGYTAFGY